MSSTNQIRLFCAECGRTDSELHKSFCQDCYWKIYHLANPKLSEVHIPLCIECLSVKIASGWQRYPNEEDMKMAISNSTSKYLGINSGVIINIESTMIDWDNPKLFFTATYVIEDQSIENFDVHQESYEILHHLDKGVCKSCTIKASGARNVTVQARANHRDMDAREKERFKSIAIELVKNSNYEVRSNYLSKIEEVHGGLDLIFGNTQIAENFLHEIEKHIIGEREKNFKLVTEDKQGNRIYSITYLFRIPEFRRNDYVARDNSLYKVENVTSRGITLISLRDRQKELVKEYHDLHLVNKEIQLYPKIILSENIAGESYMIMDASTFNNEEVLISDFPIKLPVGDQIDFISWCDSYYLDLVI